MYIPPTGMNMDIWTFEQLFKLSGSCMVRRMYLMATARPPRTVHIPAGAERQHSLRSASHLRTARDLLATYGSAHFVSRALTRSVLSNILSCCVPALTFVSLKI